MGKGGKFLEATVVTIFDEGLLFISAPREDSEGGSLISGTQEMPLSKISILGTIVQG